MNTSLKPESALRKEWRLFKAGFVRLVNAYLNRMFDLSPKAASGRFWAFVILFFASGFLLSLINYPLNLWLARLQDIFLYYFNTAYRAAYTAGEPISNLILFALQVFFDPKNLRFIPLLLAPYFISLQSAAIYLADIFNLDDVSIARRHIVEVALGGSDETIRISKGEIAEESRKSPNVLIGGPGKVIVDLDSAALFEKSDGTPHIIGPTNNEPRKRATLEGFERFRQAIELRDQFIDLRDQDDKSPSVKSRSLDGIPIAATDVRLMFSIHRHGQRPSTENPYPFSKDAVEKIIYNSVSRVTPDLPDPSYYEFSWIHNMISLIRSELGGFMNQRKLTDYLATTGIPEAENLMKQQDEIAKQAHWLNSPPDFARSTNPKSFTTPEFTSRDKVTNLFSVFTGKFTEKAQQRGVELHWIGVGTWKSPVEKVVEKHIDAWKLSRENYNLGGAEAMQNYENEVITQKLVFLIQDTPLWAYQKVVAAGQNQNDAMKSLLVAYRQQLLESITFLKDKGEATPSTISNALKIIDAQLGYHWVGRARSESPAKPNSLSLPKPVVIIDQAVGIARIKDLPRNRKLRIGKSYHLQVDILKDLKEGSIPLDIFSEEKKAIDIIVQADEMSISPDWFHEVLIGTDGKSNSPEFTITPLRPGLKTITIQYYYKSHWLTQTRYQVEVLNKEPITI